MKRTAIFESFITVLLFCLTSGVFAQVPAFPGAEGAGKWATGGRGGDVYEVTNLNNSGAGSIADAMSQGNRTIVFRVSGTIDMNGVMLYPKSNITIAGQTAPGDGICIKGRIQIGVKGTPGVDADNIIIRYIRVRVDAGRENSLGDAIDIAQGNNIIIDHVSASYARDEGISCQEKSDNVTVQWCIISEGLNFEDHSYGSLIRGTNGQQKTYHHNLYAHNRGRNPRPGNYISSSSDPEGLHFDFRNNVVYNWISSTAGYNDDSTVSRYNFIGNAYIQGPNSSGTIAFRDKSYVSYGYFQDNSMGGVVPANPWSLIYLNMTTAQQTAYKARSYLVPMESVTTTSPAIAKTDVLAGAGTSFPTRDSVDTRIVDDVINITGKILFHTDLPAPTGGWWPTLNSATAPTDSDHDGMPDEWELAVCLNPNDASDRNDDRNSDGYTNVEEYLNWLVSDEPMPAHTDVNRDGIVDFIDFSEFANRWMSVYGDEVYSGRFDYGHNDAIEMDDLFYIAQDWLTSGQEY
jgi:pectate lyase